MDLHTTYRAGNLVLLSESPFLKQGLTDLSCPLHTKVPSPLVSHLLLAFAILQQGGPLECLDLTLGNQWPKLEGCWGPLPEHNTWVPWARDPHDPAPAHSPPPGPLPPLQPLECA